MLGIVADGSFIAKTPLPAWKSWCLLRSNQGSRCRILRFERKGAVQFGKYVLLVLVLLVAGDVRAVTLIEVLREYDIPTSTLTAEELNSDVDSSAVAADAGQFLPRVPSALARSYTFTGGIRIVGCTASRLFPKSPWDRHNSSCRRILLRPQRHARRQQK